MPIPNGLAGPASRGLEAIWHKLRPEPAAVLERRAAIRNEIREHLPHRKPGEVPEVLVVNYAKFDRYGNLDERLIQRGASDWFKAEVKGLHDRGFEVYSSIEYVVIRRGKAYRVLKEDTPGARTVWVVGRIRYERIKYIDWEPDPNYGAPRLYVVYGWRRNPFREVVLYEESGWKAYQYEVAARYIGEGGGPIKRLRRTARRGRYRWEERRERKRFVREGD